MGWQGTLAGLLVALCAAYLVWAWLPGELRARCVARLHGQRPAVASAGGCCGCDGCGESPRPACRDGAARDHVIRIAVDRGAN